MPLPYCLLLVLLYTIANPVLSQNIVQDIISTRLDDVLRSPETIISGTPSAPPENFYSDVMIKMQMTVNKTHIESVISDPSPVSKWTEIDFDPITPYTWRWVDLKGTQEDGTISKISLRRPIWWLEKNNIDHIGNHVLLEIPEMDLRLQAIVVDIRANQLDTRFWTDGDAHEYFSMPITGKFSHISNDVYALYFNDQEDPLKVTGNHLIWSAHHKGWVSAKEIVIGEQLKTLRGEVSVREIKKLPGIFEVYNLEIYRTHNYHVTRNSILVHNECWNPHWQKILDNIGGRLYSVAIQDVEHIQRIRIIYQPAKNFRGDYGNDWRDLYTFYGKKDVPTAVQINVDVTGLPQSEIEYLGDIARNNGFVAYTDPMVDLQKAKVNGEQRIYMQIRRYGNDALPGHGEGAPINSTPETVWKPGRR